MEPTLRVYEEIKEVVPFVLAVIAVLMWTSNSVFVRLSGILGIGPAARGAIGAVIALVAVAMWRDWNIFEDVVLLGIVGTIAVLLVGRGRLRGAAAMGALGAALAPLILV